MFNTLFAYTKLYTTGCRRRQVA